MLKKSKSLMGYFQCAANILTFMFCGCDKMHAQKGCW